MLIMMTRLLYNEDGDDDDDNGAGTGYWVEGLAASKAIGYESMRAPLITLTTSTDDHTQIC